LFRLTPGMCNELPSSLHIKCVWVEIELEDAELVRRIGSGSDREAEAELFRRMAPRIRLYGLRHLRDPAASDDLTQQVLVTTLGALRAGRLREPEKLASFVLGTCRMTVLDLRRGAQRKKRLLEEFGADLMAPDLSSVPDLDHERLSRCVQSLKERERTVIVMTFYDERTGADVAGFLGVSEANVRVIRHRAIHRLRECMEMAA
jgi:RNA polymerase sigma-70 factor, ECF subfamily